VARSCPGCAGGSGVCTFRVGSVGSSRSVVGQRGEPLSVLCLCLVSCSSPAHPQTPMGGGRSAGWLQSRRWWFEILIQLHGSRGWPHWPAGAHVSGRLPRELASRHPTPPAVLDLWGLFQSCRPPLDSIRLGIRNPAAQRSRGGHMTSKLFLVLLTCRAPGVIGFEVHRACRLAGLLRKMYLCTLALAPSTTVLYTVHGR
jgi:hypothetical protein